MALSQTIMIKLLICFWGLNLSGTSRSQIHLIENFNFKNNLRTFNLKLSWFFYQFYFH